MIIAGSLANVSGSVKTEEFLRFVKEEMPQVRAFKLSPPPGRMMAAAIDWQMVINTGASLIALAEVLWKGYQKFIVPLRISRKDSQAGLFLMLQNPGGPRVHIMLQKDFQSKKDFTSEIIRAFGAQADISSSSETTPEPDLWKEIT